MIKQEYVPAHALLNSLLADSPSAALRSAAARVYLQAGELGIAREQFAAVEKELAESKDGPDAAKEKMKQMNRALMAAAEGGWAELVKGSTGEGLKGDIVATNNVAVGLLCQGKLKEAIHVLEAVLNTSPSAVAVAEPVLFNLSTLYELRAGLSAQKKRDLLVEVAKWSGDGLRTSCLKMPA